MRVFIVDDDWCFYVDQNNIPDGCVGHKCNKPKYNSDYVCLCPKEIKRAAAKCVDYIDKKDAFYSYPIYSTEGNNIRLLKTLCPNCSLQIPNKLIMMVNMLL